LSELRGIKKYYAQFYVNGLPKYANTGLQKFQITNKLYNLWTLQQQVERYCHFNLTLMIPKLGYQHAYVGRGREQRKESPRWLLGRAREGKRDSDLLSESH
jgi:hypothetical protein